MGHAVDLGADVLEGALSVGETAMQGAAELGSAVVEHAGDVAEVVEDAVGTVIGGILDLRDWRQFTNSVFASRPKSQWAVTGNSAVQQARGERAFLDSVSP